MITKVYFWQLIVSPHMASLAVSLAEKGIEVHYIVSRFMSKERSKLGWKTSSLPGVHLNLVRDINTEDVLRKNSSRDCVHICQGMRANGYISDVLRHLIRLNAKFAVILETVDDSNLKGIFKRLLYRWLIAKIGRHASFILANGKATKAWLVARGARPARVYEFAYFLPAYNKIVKGQNSRLEPFVFIFVGQFIKRKRLDLLIDALSLLKSEYDFRLEIVGNGSLEKKLRMKAQKLLGNRLLWVGQLPIDSVRDNISSADCLVLPSKHDGWGAVVSEALQLGTRVICSDTCGSSVLIEASRYGSVFKSGSLEDLKEKLQSEVLRGKLAKNSKQEISYWANRISADAGANYLLEILAVDSESSSLPVVPWFKN